MTIRYDPVGECIYCGTKKGKLQQEHIIPFALNGDLILPDASCAACAARTGAIEQHNLRKLFGPVRALNGMRTRRPKERPKSIPMKADYEDGRSATVDVPIEEFPAMIGLPMYPEARFLLGLPDTDEPTMARWWFWHRDDKVGPLARKIGLQDGAISIGTCNPTKLSQMLAKIAHGAAVGFYGIDGFTPFAVDLALGRTEHMNYLVGCDQQDELPPPAGKRLHEILFLENDTNALILVQVRLFSSLGAPWYHIVVGEKR